MTCRAKFKVQKVTSYGGVFREVTLEAVFDDGIAKENKSFATETPNGTLNFSLNNPALADSFVPGEYYYLDFTKAAQ